MGAIADTARPALDPVTLKARFKQLQQQTHNVHQNWQIRVRFHKKYDARYDSLPQTQPSECTKVGVSVSTVGQRSSDRSE